MIWTSMGSSYYYDMYYKNIAMLIVLGIIPLVLLIYWNHRIYKCMKSSLNVVTTKQGQEHRNNQEKEMAKVLIGIVFIFILCHTLRIFLDIYDASTLKHGTFEKWLCMSLGKEGLPPKWKLFLTEISNLMLAINSSVNMIVYCCLNSSFRKNMFIWSIKRNEKEQKGTDNEENQKEKDNKIIWNHNFDKAKSSIYVYD